MGIKGLAKLLSDEAPECIEEQPLNSLQGRRVAIDASMAIYQFLIAVRTGSANHAAAMLTNSEGEVTSHVQGMFNRTVRYLSEGIRPVFVFDGKPPVFKSGELLKRRAKRAKAEVDLKAAQEAENIEEQDKHNKRLVRAGTKENDDCKRLLRLMGVPVVEAPCEAEAQAAALCAAGKVYAVGTEDMDALTFATPVLLRKMAFANDTKFKLQVMHYKKAVDGLGLTHAEFVDLCILMGCDYCDPIRGVGPKTALKLIREHKNIETILQNISDKKYTVPAEWLPPKKNAAEEGTDDETPKEDEEPFVPVYVHARRLFNEHEVTPPDSFNFKWGDTLDADALTKFLVEDMSFSADRVANQVLKLKKAFASTKKPQARMDSFFKVVSKPKPKAGAGEKRKGADKKKAPTKKRR
eukprot:CAMPEP_0194272680 /NCGR_PEP_ID=MMETSP0169-20130528/6175_1 /TAXON_ID=218684 /ORGANISM="Corethron pennatum, Strain L29A3" /LENGTH=408 /DNA_ID=CAMNT_0039015399 /DNA_START=50 /DNA_END=1276 /DNA_ORIENTATION=-